MTMLLQLPIFALLFLVLIVKLFLSTMLMLISILASRLLIMCTSWWICDKAKLGLGLGLGSRLGLGLGLVLGS